MADPITKQKSIYDRARSTEAVRTPPAQQPIPRTREVEDGGTLPEVENPVFRPKSFYPRMSHVPADEEDGYSLGTPSEEQFVTPGETTSPRKQDYFGSPSSKSPETAIPRDGFSENTYSNGWVFPPRNQDTPHAYAEPQRGLSIESSSSKSYTSSLAPPAQNQNRSQHVRQAPSVRSIPQDSSDDDQSASTGGSGFSRPRKLSSSSNVSMPQSPFSPFAQATHHGRSPSLNSEYSLGGSRLPRPAFNFSRPLSRASRPSMDVPGRQPSFEDRPSTESARPSQSSLSRQQSNESQQSGCVADPGDRSQTPMSNDLEHSPDSSDMPAPSYVYTKFSLPRGRVVQRDSKVLENKQVPLFEWERPAFQSNVQQVRPTTPLANRPLSPLSAGQYSPKLSIEMRTGSPRRPSFDNRPHSSPRPSIDQNTRTRPSNEYKSNLNPNRRPSAAAPSADDRRPSAAPPVVDDDQSEYSASTRSGSTIKPSSHHHKSSPSVEVVSAEDHLAKGIALHERGEIKESTYHLRIAAKANLPTAMLLYALACRHGWGMRPNPKEGVMWLRKAADCASLEIATSDDDGKNQGDVIGRKTRRAQFAYAIYELGISHMNGLGIEQDKTLALRCFEIAANWGDVDAMAEAGFCYAEAQGCRKDLRKAARYYKMAEAKGMSMVGNSWYVCSRYLLSYKRRCG